MSKFSCSKNTNITPTGNWHCACTLVFDLPYSHCANDNKCLLFVSEIMSFLT